eukprot:scaffold47_cov258-Pinguiococcus_pyrenoidosus.AAC.15
MPLEATPKRAEKVAEPAADLPGLLLERVLERRTDRKGMDGHEDVDAGLYGRTVGVREQRREQRR